MEETGIVFTADLVYLVLRRWYRESNPQSYFASGPLTPLALISAIAGLML